MSHSNNIPHINLDGEINKAKHLSLKIWETSKMEEKNKLALEKQPGRPRKKYLTVGLNRWT